MFLQPATSSGRKTASTLITNMCSFLIGIDVVPPDTGQVSIIIYDSENTDTTNKLILSELHVDAGMPTLNHEYIRSLYCNRGIYAEMTESTPGSNSKFIVRYAL